MRTYKFWDLAETLNDYNLQDFAITGFKKRVGAPFYFWNSYYPDVVNGYLVGRNAKGDIVLQGGDLIGAKFEIHNRVTDEDIEMQVFEIGRVPLFVQPQSGIWLSPTYRLKWKLAGSAVHPADLCGSSTENDGVEQFHAILFDDDWIDADAIRVLDLPRSNWFNIGCKGHALAKQHLLGHTKAAAALTNYSTPIDARTANLKMLTGDYCGNGHPFTVAGEKLYWFDKHTNYNLLSNLQPFPPAQIEARWHVGGATCLNTPRVDFNQSELGVATFPPPDGVEGLLDIADGWCTASNPRPPPCTGSMTDPQGADIISVVQLQ